MSSLKGLKTKVGIKSLPFLKRPGITYVYCLAFEDGTGELLKEKLIPVFVDIEIKDCNQKLGKKVINGINMDSHPQLNKTSDILKQQESLRISAERYISNKIINLRKEIKNKRESKIQKELNSLKKYEKTEKKRLRQYINKYKREKGKGREMEISIRRQKYRLKKLEERIEQRRNNIYKKSKVIALAPEIIGCCISLPIT